MGITGEVKPYGHGSHYHTSAERAFLSVLDERDERIERRKQALLDMSPELRRERVLASQRAIQRGGERDREHQATVAAAVELVQAGVMER